MKDKTIKNSIIFIVIAQIVIILIGLFLVPLLHKPSVNSENFNIQTINLRTILFTFALIKLSTIILIIVMPLKCKKGNEDEPCAEFLQPKLVITALLYLYTYLWFVVCTYICHIPAVEIIVFNSVFTAFCHIALVVRANKKRMNLAFNRKTAIRIIVGFVVLYLVITVLSILKAVGVLGTVPVIIGGVVLNLVFLVWIALCYTITGRKKHLPTESE